MTCSLREKIRPSKTTQSVHHRSQENQLIHRSIDRIIAWSGSPTSIEQMEFFGPEHEEHTSDSKHHNNRLQRYKETHKQK
jgi:hypothetical protein